MPKDRLTGHIEELKATIQTLQETDSRIARYVSLQESLMRAEAVNEEIREAEERIASIAEPRERKPRTRKYTEGLDTNGAAHVYKGEDSDPTVVTQPASE